MPNIIVYNGQTGQAETRPMTPEEEAQYLLDQQAEQTRLAAEEVLRQESSTVRALVIQTAQTAVGITVDQLTIGQTRALVAILLYKAGALTPTGAVKPLNQWA